MGRQVDPRTGADVLEKRTTENRLYTFDFTGLLNGNTVSSISSVTAANRGLVAGSGALTIGSTAVSGVNGQVRLSGGTNNEDYLVVMTVVDTGGNTLVGEGILQVRDKS